MRPGRLRESIVIMRKSVSRGEIGQEITQWTQRAKVFAEVNRDQSSESPKRNFEGEHEEPATFLIRYRSDISSADHIVHNSKTYSIDGMKPLSLTRYNDALEIRGVHRVSR